MAVRENVGVFHYHSGNSQGILIHVLGINPVDAGSQPRAFCKSSYHHHHTDKSLGWLAFASIINCLHSLLSNAILYTCRGGSRLSSYKAPSKKNELASHHYTNKSLEWLAMESVINCLHSLLSCAILYTCTMLKFVSSVMLSLYLVCIWYLDRTTENLKLVFFNSRRYFRELVSLLYGISVFIQIQWS